MSVLDDSLEELGFAHKPGSTKGRMASSRFYNAELKREIKRIFIDLVNSTDLWKDSAAWELEEKVKGL